MLSNFIILSSMNLIAVFIWVRCLSLVITLKLFSSHFFLCYTHIRDLCVLLDCRLNMIQQVSSTARTCFFHLRRIRQVRRCLDETCRRILIQALVVSQLDDGNSVLSGLPSSTLQHLSSVLHTAARLIKDPSPTDHITPTLKQLHWLPIHARIAFKNLPPHQGC